MLGFSHVSTESACLRAVRLLQELIKWKVLESNFTFLWKGCHKTIFGKKNYLFILGHPLVRRQFLGSMPKGKSFSAKKMTESMSQGSSYISCLEAVLLQHVRGQFLCLMSEGSFSL